MNISLLLTEAKFQTSYPNIELKEEILLNNLTYHLVHILFGYTDYLGQHCGMTCNGVLTTPSPTTKTASLAPSPKMF